MYTMYTVSSCQYLSILNVWGEYFWVHKNVSISTVNISTVNSTNICFYFYYLLRKYIVITLFLLRWLKNQDILGLYL